MAAAAAAKLVVGPLTLLLPLLMFMGEEIDMSDDNGNDEVGGDCGVDALTANVIPPPVVVLLPATAPPPPLTPPLVDDET